MSEHVHVFGRSAYGKCQECGAESNASRKRREARERKAAQRVEPKGFDLYTALRTKGGFDYEGNAE